MINDLLNRLHKVKQTGQGRWIACCCVHEDKHPSMSITEKNDTVLIYCHSCGANGKDVCEALGLEPFILFGEEFIPGEYKKPRIPASDILKCLSFESLFLKVCAFHLKNGEQLSNNDIERLNISHNRIVAACIAGGIEP
jgi:hypothetical protein